MSKSTLTHDCNQAHSLLSRVSEIAVPLLEIAGLRLRLRRFQSPPKVAERDIHLACGFARRVAQPGPGSTDKARRRRDIETVPDINEGSQAFSPLQQALQGWFNDIQQSTIHDQDRDPCEHDANYDHDLTWWAILVGMRPVVPGHH